MKGKLSKNVWSQAEKNESALFLYSKYQQKKAVLIVNLYEFVLVSQDLRKS